MNIKAELYGSAIGTSDLCKDILSMNVRVRLSIMDEKGQFRQEVLLTMDEASQLQEQITKCFQDKAKLKEMVKNDFSA